MNEFETNMIEVESFRTENVFVYNWTFHDFDCQNAKDDEELPSVKFEFKLQSDIHFQAELYLIGEECLARNFMFKLLSSTHKNWIVSCEFSLNKKINFVGKINNIKSYLIFLLHKNAKCFLAEGTNTITCKILHVSYIERPKLNLPEIEDPHLHPDLEKLFRNRKFWDVEFLVAGQEMYAHKCILSSRSKVFADMFERPMKKVKPNEQSNSVAEAEMDSNVSKTSTCPCGLEIKDQLIIADTEPEVFEEILRFAYTERVQNLDKMPSRLLVASTKYGLDRLKSLCEQELARKISIESAAETLILADLHGSPELKKLSIDFIKKHSKAILTTKGWQKIVKDHINLLTELYIEIVQ